jgi:hypothetical protein
MATTYIESEVVGRTIIHPFHISRPYTSGPAANSAFYEGCQCRIADGVHIAWVGVRDDEIIPSFTRSLFR